MTQQSELQTLVDEFHMLEKEYLSLRSNIDYVESRKVRVRKKGGYVICSVVDDNIISSKDSILEEIELYKQWIQGIKKDQAEQAQFDEIEAKLRLAVSPEDFAFYHNRIVPQDW